MLRAELSRLTRFGANVADALSCLIFLPSSVARWTASQVPVQTTAVVGEDTLDLVAAHSLAQSILPTCKLPLETGLVGWVAKHNRSIHVSPFDRDSRTLGTYAEDEKLKSWVGVPIPLDFIPATQLVGVLSCDSKKSFAFSKLHVKLIEELALQVSCTLRLSLQTRAPETTGLTWQQFMERGMKLHSALGAQAAEMLRIKVDNFDELENALGTERAVDVWEQTRRLVQQTLPPHFPSFRLPTGEMLVVVDNMMSAYLQNRIHVVCSHGSSLSVKPRFSFSKAPFPPARSDIIRLERPISSAMPELEGMKRSPKVMYGNSRS